MELGMDVTSHGHKRADEEIVDGGDAKKPPERSSNNDGWYMDEDEHCDGNTLDDYREGWITTHGKSGSFEDETQIKAMQHTDGPVLPYSSWPMDLLQIFSVKVTEIMGALQWPLDIYGLIAVRDSLDYKRNILFRRDREDCQTLTSPQDSHLTLTGPSRAVALINPVIFEVDLKVKSRGSPYLSEDQVLCHHAFCYHNIIHMDKAGSVQRAVESTEHSTMEFIFAHLKHAVEATIMVRVIEGSTDFKARFTAHTDTITEDVLLLDSGDEKVVVVADDGLIVFKRRVVVVEEKGKLVICVEARDGGGGESGVKRAVMRPRMALRTEGTLKLGFSTLVITVAWSLVP